MVLMTIREWWETAVSLCILPPQTHEDYYDMHNIGVLDHTTIG